GGRGHQEGEHHFQHEHHVDEDDGGEAGHDPFCTVQNGVGDHAVVHHHHDTARDTDDEGHAEQIAGTTDEVGGQLLFTHAGDDADDDGGSQEDAGDLRHPPAQHGHPVDHHGKGGDEDTQHNLAGSGELQHLVALVAKEVGTVLFPLVGH